MPCCTLIILLNFLKLYLEAQGDNYTRELSFFFAKKLIVIIIIIIIIINLLGNPLLHPKKFPYEPTWSRTPDNRLIRTEPAPVDQIAYSDLDISSRGGLMFLGPKAKIDYLVLYAKLLLINNNYVEFFFFFQKFYKQKKFDKIFHTC